MLIRAIPRDQRRRPTVADFQTVLAIEPGPSAKA
ncbi:hypothetical protein SAMN05421505_13414 [Sinosporangium album]|uniref:Uncharacterized protein n=1 Tax=Sinosporangium album TaxID=504805 RepID=A0A1G8HUF9_9ACTN|nr:hypothetical protein SAMN05421505_13414 [Sinosporangium album]